MISVKDLSKSYGGIRAIDSLNFEIKKGEVVGFLGPNGAGKSTTMKIITGFMAPSSGQAMIAGYDVYESPIEVKRRIGYLPETPPVYGDMRVRDFLAFVAELKLVPKNKIRSLVDSAIEKTHLEEVCNRYIYGLSKGFKQRVGIAQALVSDPEVLILDEPTVGLDPKQVAEIRDLIGKLKGHHTLILSTHILPEVEATCQRIIIINKGQIVAQDSLENLSQLQSGNTEIHLKIKNRSPEVFEKIRSMEYVKSAREGVHSQDILISVKSGFEQSAIESLAQLAIDLRWGLLSINSSQKHLEEIFLKLTYEKGL